MADRTESYSTASLGLNPQVRVDAGDILQSLLCLNTLIREDTNCSGTARLHAELAEEKLHSLCALFRPMLSDTA